MSDDNVTISHPLIQAIEDAILLGNVQELDGVLELASEDETFPPDLRYGLEALRYFRLFYGKGGALEPQDEANKVSTIRMESHWGRDLIESIGHYPDLSEAKYA